MDFSNCKQTDITVVKGYLIIHDRVTVKNKALTKNINNIASKYK